MSTKPVSHKSSHPVHSSHLDQLIMDELQGLIQSKDTLDMDYPSCKRSITHDDMWKMARQKLLENLSNPEMGATGFGFNRDSVWRF